MKKRLLSLLLIAVMVIAVAGCKQEEPPQEVTFDPSGNSLFLQQDGRVTSYLTETGFDKAYYSAEELLKSYVEPAVLEYNRAKAGVSYLYESDIPEPETEESASAASAELQPEKIVLPVAIEAVSLENGTAVMELTYGTGADYIAFNANQLPEGCELWALPARGADLSAYALTAVEGAKVPELEKITDEESKRSYFYACIKVPGTVKVQGTILYISNAAVKTDDYTVTTDGSAPVYLIFE